jgi:hypothetical protein
MHSDSAGRNAAAAGGQPQPAAGPLGAAAPQHSTHAAAPQDDDVVASGRQHTLQMWSGGG